MGKTAKEILGITEDRDLTPGEIDQAVSQAMTMGAASAASKYRSQLNPKPESVPPVPNQVNPETEKMQQELQGYKDQEFKSNLSKKVSEIAPGVDASKILKYMNVSRDSTDKEIQSQIESISSDFSLGNNSGGNIPKTFSKPEEKSGHQTEKEKFMEKLKKGLNTNKLYNNKK